MIFIPELNDFPLIRPTSLPHAIIPIHNDVMYALRVIGENPYKNMFSNECLLIFVDVLYKQHIFNVLISSKNIFKHFKNQCKNKKNSLNITEISFEFNNCLQ